MKIYTIGHSNHRWETFKKLLADKGVELLVDVRSRPVSRFAPFSNKRAFPALLETIGVRYLFMGDALGGRPDNPSLYDAEGKPDFQMMRRTQEFQDGLSDLVLAAEDSVTALMCSEGDPVKCHRRLLIGAALARECVITMHILRDGTAVSEDDLEGLQGKLAL